MPIKTHTSYHNSGSIQHDYTGKSGTEHYHEGVVLWKDNPDANGRVLYKDKDGVWRYKDDNSVFRPGN